MSPARPSAAVLAALGLGLVGGAPAPAASGPGAGWAAPVPGGVAGPFAYERAAPYRGGARRGVDLRAVRGAPVRAACSGRVTHAGPTPRGRGVTVRCGPLVATHLGLGALAVRRGERVARGARLGAAAGRVVRLGARVARDRHGYVDPLGLLGAEPAARPLVAPPPRGRPSRHGRRVARGRRPRGPVRPPRAPRLPAGTPGRGTATSALAWGALALVALAAPIGSLVRRRGRRAGAGRPVPGTGRRIP